MTLNHEVTTPAKLESGPPTSMSDTAGAPPSGETPAGLPGRRRREGGRGERVVFAVLMALVVLALAAVVAGSWRAVVLVEDDVAAVRDEVAASDRDVAALHDRLDALEAEVGGSFDATDLAERAAPSIFMVVSPATEQVVSLGTGFVLAKEERRSLVVTNFHVVEERWRTGATDVLLVRGTREYPATVVQISEADDLALLEVAADLPPLEPSDRPAQTGDSVLVVGAGDGLEGTVTIGVVSAVSRLIDGIEYLQISAQVNPGNSGGPALDADGEVIGVVTLKRVALEVEGLAFALPIDQVCSAFDVC